MGRGGDNSMASKRNVGTRLPCEKPPFTMADLKRAVPAHCFQRSLLTSSAYLVFDLAVMMVLFTATKSFNHPSLPTFAPFILWPLYWMVQGCVATGVWVIAHECGHQAFSDYGWINDSVGMILHTSLLVPYFSWKYSHRRHHSNTGSLERDEVFVPKLKEQVPPLYEYLQHPLGRVFKIFVTLTIGWPLYLAINKSGRKYDGFTSHFFPGSPIFNDRERFFVALSDAGLIVMMAILGYIGSSMGYLWLINVYGMPLMVVNAFLVLITLLQHTHPDLPHYDETEWEWLKGALSTVDRDYGILNHVFHHIADTHVAHHVFSSMPHYHAEEATRALKPILGDYYRFDSTPVPAALWRETRDCVYVESDTPGETKILWYKGKTKAT